jgi:hypothetical protein
VNIVGPFVGSSLEENVSLLEKQKLLAESSSKDQINSSSKTTENGFFISSIKIILQKNILDSVNGKPSFNSMENSKQSAFSSSLPSNNQFSEFASEIEISSTQLKKRRFLIL